MSETFELWLEEHFPDGMGNGTGGSYHQDDLEDAWNAGYDAGHAEATNHLATGGSFK